MYVQEVSLNKTMPQGSIAPNQWQGETGCLVGPFVSRDACLNFTRYAINFGSKNVSLERPILQGNAWFIQLAEK